MCIFRFLKRNTMCGFWTKVALSWPWNSRQSQPRTCGKCFVDKLYFTRTVVVSSKEEKYSFYQHVVTESLFSVKLNPCDTRSLLQFSFFLIYLKISFRDSEVSPAWFLSQWRWGRGRRDGWRPAVLPFNRCTSVMKHICLLITCLASHSFW